MYKVILLSLLLVLSTFAKRKNKPDETEFKPKTLAFYVNKEDHAEFKKISNPKILIFWQSNYLFSSFSADHSKLKSLSLNLYPISIKNDSIFTIDIVKAPDKNFLDVPSLYDIDELNFNIPDTIPQEYKLAKLNEIFSEIHDTSTSFFGIGGLLLIDDINNDNMANFQELSSDDTSKNDIAIGVAVNHSITYSSDDNALKTFIDSRNKKLRNYNECSVWSINTTGISIIKCINCDIYTTTAIEENIDAIPLRVGKDIPDCKCNFF